MLVSNGDEVKKGQLLIKMDEAASKAELEKARSQEIALTLNKERLEAYLEKKPANLLKWSQAVINSKYNTVERSEEIKELLEEERALLVSQNEKRQNQESILKDQLTQEQEQLKKFEHQLQVWDQHLKLLTEELEIFKKLKREQYVSHRGYLTILRELNSARGERARLVSEITRIKEVIIEYQHKMGELDATLNADAQKELGETTDKLLALRHQIEILENALKHSDVRSPVNGIVKGLRVYPGNVIQPAGLLVEIVPLNQEMVVETRIQPRDIGHIKVGDEVVVKPLTYRYSRYGSLKGELIKISASTFQDENNKPYYQAEIKLHQQYLMRGTEKKQLIPGMTVEADILTGKKTLIQYLLTPIRASGSGAFHER